MPSTSLDTANVIELAELLQSLADWLASGHDQLGTPLAHFVGSQAYAAGMLRSDLARLASPLGAMNKKVGSIQAAASERVTAR